MTLIDILERLDRAEETALTADGFDDCVIGLAYQFNQPLVIYSKQKIITQLMGDMSGEEAMEYFDFNIAGAYMGDSTPLFMEDLDE
jgi:hypothetical protein